MYVRVVAFFTGTTVDPQTPRQAISSVKNRPVDLVRGRPCLCAPLSTICEGSRPPNAAVSHTLAHFTPAHIEQVLPVSGVAAPRNRCLDGNELNTLPTEIFEGLQSLFYL